MTGAGCGIPAPNLIFDGDSITEGFGLTVPPDIRLPEQVTALLTYATDTTYNVAVGGQTAAQRTSAIASAVLPKFRNNGAPQVVIFWAGTNDLYFGASAATTYANIKAYCETVRASKPNAYIIVLDILPRSNSGTPGTFEASRQTVNASLAADFPTATAHARIFTGAIYANYLIQVGSDSTIGDAGDENNTTYYLDKVHMTSTGLGIPAEYIKNAVWLINPPN